MATIFNDGSFPYGSHVLSINAVNYVAEDISLDKPSTVAENMDEDGNYSGGVGAAGAITGSATLQLETTGTALPSLGQTFTSVLKNESSATYIVTQVGETISQSGITKCPIQFRKQVN